MGSMTESIVDGYGAAVHTDEQSKGAEDGFEPDCILAGCFIS